MSMESDLKALIGVYALYHSETGYQNPPLQEDALESLERSFTQLLLKWLLKDGPEKESVERNYYELVPFFKTSNSSILSLEVYWLEGQLSQHCYNGSCLRILSLCYQKLVSPEQFKTIQFHEITNQADLRHWLENLKKNAITKTEHRLYDSFLDLLQESSEFFDDIGQIKPKGMRALLSFLPMVLMSLGTALFVEEILAVYVLYWVLLKGGQSLSKSSTTELVLLGNALQKFSVTTAMNTTTLLVRLVELVFWGSHQCYLATVKTGAKLLDPLLAAPAKSLPAPEISEKELMDLAHSKQVGHNFINYQLKIIAVPIEAQKEALAQQYFLNLRAGKDKISVLDDFLFNLHMLDQNKELMSKKLDMVVKLINLIKQNKSVYVAGGKTAVAVDKAEAFLMFLIRNPFFIDQHQDTNQVENGTKFMEMAERYRLLLQH